VTTVLFLNGGCVKNTLGWAGIGLLGLLLIGLSGLTKNQGRMLEVQEERIHVQEQLIDKHKDQIGKDWSIINRLIGLLKDEKKADEIRKEIN